MIKTNINNMIHVIQNLNHNQIVKQILNNIKRSHQMMN